MSSHVETAGVTAVLADRDLSLDYQCYGNPQHPALLLIMGLATQRTAWPQAWIDALVARGFYVISFDNRDVGLSTRLNGLPLTPLWKVLSGRLLRLGSQPPYHLQDMAQDALALLAHLSIERAHVLGVSMGGMIAQWMAIEAPERVSSLSLLMSSSGRLGLPLPSAAVMRVIASRPQTGLSERDAAADYLVRFFAVVGSPAYPVAEPERRLRALAQVQRSVAGAGVMRHVAAIVADGKRCARLSEIRCVTQVLHGDADPLLPIQHGRDLAKRIPGASFRALAGIGHDVPEALAPLIANALADLAERAR